MNRPGCGPTVLLVRSMRQKDTSGQESTAAHCCPFEGCEYTSESSRGLKIHHSKRHGESIAGVTVECSWCGATKKTKPDRIATRENHFCNHECHGKWKSENNVGENNPAWNSVGVSCAACGEIKQVSRSRRRDYERHFCDIWCHADWMSDNQNGDANPNWAPRISVSCAACGQEKQVTESVKGLYDRFFCDDDCKGTYRSLNWVGKNSPAWKGGNVPVNCTWCGAVKEVRPVIAKQDHHFCDNSCFGKWGSVHYRGENNPFWKGGYDEYYGPNWEEQREKRLERDGYECVICGMGREEHYDKYACDFPIHHVQRKENFRRPDGSLDYETANMVENLRTLCSEHHALWEGLPVAPQ